MSFPRTQGTSALASMPSDHAGATGPNLRLVRPEEQATPRPFPHRVGYLIPEFPGQTHVWMWREIAHLREWGVPITLFSTRRPGERDKARHAWAEAAAAETVYLADSKSALVSATAWAAATRPGGLAAAAKTAATLPVEKGKLKTAALVAPAARLAREVERREITHLHAHTCGNGAVLCLLAGKICDVPYSLTLNADIEWWGGAMAQKFGNAAFTVAITEWLLAQMRRDFPELRGEQAILGRIGVDTQKWTPGERAETSGPLRVITAGRLHPSKGHDDLIRAVATLRRAGRDVTLRLAGNGPQRAELDALAAELGVADAVTFLGSLGEDDLMAELRASDVFAGASHREPLGVVFMEAMSLGLATVATDAGGVPEIITSGQDGLLVPPKNPDALAEVLTKLADDPALRRRLGEAGRASIAANFDSRIGARTLYERLDETGR